MRLATFSLRTAPSARARCAATSVVAFAGGTVRDRLASGDRTPPTATSYPLADVTLLAPVARPRAIFGIGLNYAKHAAETGKSRPSSRWCS